MKKETQAVPPVASDDYEIHRTIEEDGSVTYRHPVAHTVETQTDDLTTFFQCLYERMNVLVGLLDDDDYARLGCLFECLNAQANRQIHEVCEFLDASVGRIEIDIVTRGDKVYRSGRVVGVNIDRSHIVKAKQEKQEQQ